MAVITSEVHTVQGMFIFVSAKANYYRSWLHFRAQLCWESQKKHLPLQSGKQVLNTLRECLI